MCTCALPLKAPWYNTCDVNEKRLDRPARVHCMVYIRTHHSQQNSRRRWRTRNQTSQLKERAVVRWFIFMSVILYSLYHVMSIIVFTINIGIKFFVTYIATKPLVKNYINSNRTSSYPLCLWCLPVRIGGRTGGGTCPRCPPLEFSMLLYSLLKTLALHPSYQKYVKNGSESASWLLLRSACGH